MLLDEADGEAKPVSIPLRSADASEPREQQTAGADSYESDFESDHSHSQSQSSSSREQHRRPSPLASDRSYRSDTFEEEQESSERAAARDEEAADRSRKGRDREGQRQLPPQGSRASQSNADSEEELSGSRQRRRASSPTVSASDSQPSASASVRLERDASVQVDLSATAVGVNVRHPVPLALTNELRDALLARLLESLQLNPAALAAAGASSVSSPFTRVPGAPVAQSQPIAPRLDPTTLQGIFVLYII